jgi:hypothetical protein
MKIFFAAHDPGGYNLLEPIIEELTSNPNFEIYFAFAGPAFNRAYSNPLLKPYLIQLETFKIHYFENEYDIEKNKFYEIFKKISPEIVFTSTSINSNIERYSLSFAKELRIRNFVYIDSWSGQDIRFNSKEISIVPENILVCDEPMKASYQHYEQMGSVVTSVGNIHLERLTKKKAFVRNEIQNNILRVLFVTENISHYFPDNSVNEFSILDDILRAYSLDKTLDIYIRPHPLESHEHWKKYIELANHKNTYIKIFLDESNSIVDAISKSDLVLGISSMALIESSIFRVPTFSYQIKFITSDMLYIPFEIYNIFIIDEYESFNNVINNFEMYKKRSLNYVFPFIGAESKILKTIV